MIRTLIKQLILKWLSRKLDRLERKTAKARNKLNDYQGNWYN